MTGQDRLPASPAPVSAVHSGPNSVTYVYEDGRTITLHGDRPYRTNNPGNLRFFGREGAEHARRTGAIGMDGSFAVYPSVEAGEAQVLAMIRRRALEGRMLGSFLHLYAPPGENDTAAYIGVVCQALHAVPTDLLSSLTDTQVSLLVQTILLQEGGPSHGHETAAPAEGRAGR